MVERLIGRGAMAAVYLCRAPDGTAVAVKWMDDLSEPLRARFLREVRVLESIHHPGIVTMLAHGDHGGRPWLAMEHIDGPDLRVYAAKLHLRPPSERYARCRTIGQAICEALECLHQRGLVHRDVKPSNVLLDASGRLVLTDFGVVKDERDPLKTAAGLVVGTVAFAAPEQIDGGDVGPAADLFGLGCTLYYLLTLRRPFDGIDRATTPAPPPSRFDPTIPPGLEATVLRLLAPDPTDRWPDAARARKALSESTTVGTPLAGRRDVLAQVAACLDRAATGTPLAVFVTGPSGTGRGWLADTLHAGAVRRGIAVAEVTEQGAASAVGERLLAREPLLVIARCQFPLPDGVESVEIRLSQLGVADVRRSLVAAAPLTPEPSVTAERLHRLTGGLAALLMPMLEQYTRGGRFVPPDLPSLPVSALHMLDGLDIDDTEVLGAVASVDGAVTLGLIEAVTSIPAEPVVARLAERGLVITAGSRVALGAELFRAAAIARLADPEGLRERADRAAAASRLDVDDTGRAETQETVTRAGRLAVEGRLAEALELAHAGLDRARASGERDLECRATRSLGGVLLDIGLVEPARKALSDASALARAANDDTERRLAHVLRARAVLDAAIGGRPAAASAVDRLLPLVAGASSREADASDALLFATWARASAVLSDRRTWLRARAEATLRSASLDAEPRARVAVQLALAAAALGELDEARSDLAGLPDLSELPLLQWQVDRLFAELAGETLPPPEALTRGLPTKVISALSAGRAYLGPVR